MIRSFLFLAASAAWAQSPESIEAQKKSAALQREIAARYRAFEAPIESPAPVCEPLPDETITPMIEAAAKGQKLPTKLLRAVAKQESAFRPCAVSKHGAQGLMQLMPATAEQFEVDDPFDAKANLEAGAKFLRQLLEKYKGDLALSLAAYNAGPAIVEEAKGIPEIPETRDYVEAIIGKMGVKRIDLPNIPTPRPIGN